MPLRSWLANMQAWRKSISKRARHLPKVVLGLYVGFGVTDQILHFDRESSQPTLQQRIDAVRQMLQQNASYKVQNDEAGEVRPGQWWNWGNWPNYWNNYWGNYGN